MARLICSHNSPFLTRLAEESAKRSAADYLDLNAEEDGASDDEVLNTASLTEMFNFKYQEDRSDFIAEFTSHNEANRNSQERLNSEYISHGSS